MSISPRKQVCEGDILLLRIFASGKQSTFASQKASFTGVSRMLPRLTTFCKPSASIVVVLSSNRMSAIQLTSMSQLCEVRQSLELHYHQTETLIRHRLRLKRMTGQALPMLPRVENDRIDSMSEHTVSRAWSPCSPRVPNLDRDD